MRKTIWISEDKLNKIDWIIKYNKACDKWKDANMDDISLFYSYFTVNEHKLFVDEILNKMPEDIIDEAKRNFDQRLQKIDWNIYFNDLPFNPSALSLYKWAPIAEELKTLDRKIVLNSVILKWDIVKKEFKERVKF